jgi:hypothetical protein
MEIILAFSLFTFFTISIFTLNTSLLQIRKWSSDELVDMKDKIKKLDLYIKTRIIKEPSFLFSMYGNESTQVSIDPFDVILSGYESAYGRNTCSPRINFKKSNILYHPNGIMLGTGNSSTDIEVRNSIVYLSTDSSVSSKPDLYIIDAKDQNNPYIISSINTGPGIRAIEIAGPYIFIANSSTNAQFQIVDIRERSFPTLISSLKLPLPEASTTPTHARSIFYNDGYIYLGTEKWDGREFYIIDVHDVYLPKIVGSFETGTLVNDIYVKGNIAYLATSDILQMRVLDISQKNNIFLMNSFSPSGWQTQEGKIFDYFESNITFGRTVGGFNNTQNHEVFVFSTTSDYISTSTLAYISHDILGGVYGIILRTDFIILITHNTNHEFQVWDKSLTNKIFDMSLGFLPWKMTCDWSDIYVVTGDDTGYRKISL